MSAKMAMPGLQKIKVSWEKDYDVIIFVNDVTNEILSRSSNYIVHAVTWPKFAKSLNLTRKTSFFTGGLSSSSVIWDWH